MAVVAVAGLSGCGDGERISADDRGRHVARDAPAGSPVERIVARNARLTPGRHNVRLLRVPRIGGLFVGCDNDGQSSASLVARGATMDVVVETAGDAVHGEIDPGERFTPPGGEFAVGIQRWQIGAFTKAQAPVATISVAARPACAISAQAVVFQSTAGTLTR